MGTVTTRDDQFTIPSFLMLFYLVRQPMLLFNLLTHLLLFLLDNLNSECVAESIGFEMTFYSKFYFDPVDRNEYLLPLLMHVDLATVSPPCALSTA